jgi:hypothetical protein
MELTRRRMLVGAGATGVAALGAGLVLGRGGPPTVGAGQRTSFGSVALLGWSRRSLAGPADHAAGHVHEGASVAAGQAPVPSAVHGAWTDALTVDVSVHNVGRTPIELSPGQFRVRVAGGDMTVSLYATDRQAGPVAAGETAVLRIDYLVPPVGLVLALEFADALSDRTLQLGRLASGSI